MTTIDTVDAARVALLLSELRLPGIKLIWADFVEEVGSCGADDLLIQSW
jgi:hypothetical protein